jgi:uncharacterized membrane protein
LNTAPHTALLSSPPAALIEPRRVEVGRGVSWLGEAFDLFKREPGNWIGIFVVYLLIMLAATLVPGGSILLSLAGPVFTGGIMRACDSQAAGQKVNVAQLFDCFGGTYLGPLVLLALIYFGACLMLVVIGGVLALTMFGMSLGDFSAGTIPPSQFLLPLALLALVLLALYIPIAMGMWLAPALIVLRGAAPWDAFKLSFRGCLVNMLPFLIYGVIALVIALLASIPLFLGWLVAAPLFFISVYTGYRDIFPPPEPPPLQATPPPQLFV